MADDFLDILASECTTFQGKLAEECTALHSRLVQAFGTVTLGLAPQGLQPEIPGQPQATPTSIVPSSPHPQCPLPIPSESPAELEYPNKAARGRLPAQAARGEHADPDDQDGLAERSRMSCESLKTDSLNSRVEPSTSRSRGPQGSSNTEIRDGGFRVEAFDRRSSSARRVSSLIQSSAHHNTLSPRATSIETSQLRASPRASALLVKGAQAQHTQPAHLEAAHDLSDEGTSSIDSRRISNISKACFATDQAWVKPSVRPSRKSGLRGHNHSGGLFSWGAEHTPRVDAGKCKQWVMRRMITPYSPQHAAWIFASVVLLAYDTVVIPLEMFGPVDYPFTNAMTWLLRSFWTFDMIVSFSTGYVNSQGAVIKEPTLVARRYLKNYFMLDFLIVLATWLELIYQSRATGLVRNIKIIRFVRLLRLKKGREFFLMLSEYVRAEKIHVMTSTTRVLALFAVMMHLISCTWYAVSSLTQSHGQPSWVEMQHDDMQNSLAHKWTYSFHFAFSLFFGEHVAQPYNMAERVFVIIVLYGSFVGQIVLVSSITTAMTHLEIVSSKRSTMFWNLARFLTCQGISRELELKVQRNARHALKERERSTEEESIELLSMISKPLLMDLHREIYLPTLAVHPVFRCSDLLSSPCVRAVCHRAVTVHKFVRDDLVFSADEKPSFGPSGLGAFLSVMEGVLLYDVPPSLVTDVDAVATESRHTDVATGTGSCSMPLGESRSSGGEASRLRATRCAQLQEKRVARGKWLSEAVLWTSDWVHCGTLTASTDCRLVAVDALDFREVMGSWQLPQAVDYANSFVQHLNDDIEVGILSDLGEVNRKLCNRVAAVFEEEWAEVKDDYMRDMRRTRSSGYVENAKNGIHNMFRASQDSNHRLSSIQELFAVRRTV